MFIWLSDVPESHGPTHLVPLPVTASVPALPHGYLRPQRPDFYQHERSGAGSAGTVVAYSTTPSTAAPRSPRRARPDSAPTSATSMPTTTGPAATGEHRIERLGELPGPVPDQEPEPSSPSPRSLTGSGPAEPSTPRRGARSRPGHGHSGCPPR